MDFYFKPMSCGFKDNILRVQPDILPADPLYIGACWLNGEASARFQPLCLDGETANYAGRTETQGSNHPKIAN